MRRKYTWTLVGAILIAVFMMVGVLTLIPLFPEPSTDAGGPDQVTNQVPNQVFSNGWTYDSDTGDLDNDGDLDLAIAGGNVQDSVWINNGRGEFEMLQTSFLGNQGCGVCVGDLDQDGDLDLVFTHDPGQSSTGKVYIWFNNF